MSHLPKRDFKRGILEELAQVERWMTTCTRLATCKQLVRVVQVFRDTPVVRTTGGCRTEGVINGILMEYCDQGELTSYLWDVRENRPKSFDEATAQFLFGQVIDLLVQLFSPPQETGMSVFGYDNDDGNASLPPTPGMGYAIAMPAVPEDGGLPYDFPYSPPPLLQERSSNSMWPFLAGLAPLTECVREESLSLPSPVLSGMYRDNRENSIDIKYYHNDIKTENLVLSGTTLKLVDFQSLTPLSAINGSGAMHVQIEHATQAYKHRRHNALPDDLEAAAECSAIWACGVVLVRLLAGELPSNWVYQKRGLGEQEELEAYLPEGHCLLANSSTGPRNLLDTIFSAERTPRLAEVRAHGWSAEASRMTKLKDKKVIEEVRRVLLERQPEVSDSAFIAWVPLTGCVRVHGTPTPIAIVEEIISTAISLSAGLFHDDGCRQRQRREDESFHEWHVVVSPDTDDVCNSNGFEASPKEQRQGRSLSISPNVSREVSPSLSPVVSPVTSPQLSPRGNHLGSPEMNVRQTQSPLETPILETASNAPGARPKIAWTHNRHVLDRFCIQVRPKDELGEDDPAGLYWLRIRWLPPTIRRKQGDPLLNLASTRRGDHHSPECSNFVQLQQLLLEGRNEVSQRHERKTMQVAKRPAHAGVPLLPIMSR